MKLLKVILFFNLFLSFVYAADTNMPDAFVLYEIDVGSKNCSIAPAVSAQNVNQLKIFDFVKATFTLTDGVKIADLPDDLSFSWKPLKGQAKQVCKSAYQWTCLKVTPIIDEDFRDYFKMSKQEVLFFELNVKIANGILSLHPEVTMIHQLAGREIRKTIFSSQKFSANRMIPDVLVYIL